VGVTDETRGQPAVPDIEAWDAWSPRVMADRLARLDLPWCVAAGWALDLFRGGQTRPHADLEIAVPSAEFPRVAARFEDCSFRVAHDGKLLPLTAETMSAGHQTWAWERASGRWRFDVFREPHDDDGWICRRDHRIRRPYAEIIERDADGIPYLAPEIVLLFKAKNPREKDESDFQGVLPLLKQERRRWLDDALARVSPTHPWRRLLAVGG
jgi:hypothetical protein